MPYLHLAVVRHVPDPVRDEPRNVGVIGWTPDSVFARFIGESGDGELNLRNVPPSVIQDRHTYRDWVNFWRGAIESRSLVDPEGVTVEASDPAFLDSLAGSTWGNYEIRLGAEMSFPEEDPDLGATVGAAYARIVRREEEAFASPQPVREEPRRLSHKELAQNAYYELKRRDYAESKDFVRHYRAEGSTRDGTKIPAVFDFGILPLEPLPLLRNAALAGGRKLLVDAVSLNAPGEDEEEVVDRARAVATKAREVLNEESETDVRALVTNGTSSRTDVGRYALSILGEDEALKLVTLPEFLDLLPQYRGLA